MKNENPPLNIMSEAAMEKLQSGTPVKMIYRDRLAEKLGISPKERLTMTLMDNGHNLLGISVLLGRRGPLPRAGEGLSDVPRRVRRLPGWRCPRRVPREAGDELAMTEDPPQGLYGVWCEPRGHLQNPRWLDQKPLNYEEAAKLADQMCRANKEWHYSAKPVPA